MEHAVQNRENGATKNVEDVRRAAIDHHHDVVSIFESYYKDLEENRFKNAFTYGRYKMDVLLDRELDRLPKGARVLDVGCGTGAYLRRFQSKGLDPVGVEPAEGMIATALPFPAASMDALVSIEVLRYLHREDVRVALAEFLRVLKPGGLMFITLVNRLALDGFYLHQRLRQRRRGVEYDRKNPHCEFFTPREAEEELRRLGGVDVRTEGRLLAPMRIAYKLNERLGGRLAERIEKLDDGLHERFAFTKPFAGHLVLLGRAPQR
jgi:SAM-dependent methyltransferase